MNNWKTQSTQKIQPRVWQGCWPVLSRRSTSAYKLADEGSVGGGAQTATRPGGPPTISALKHQRSSGRRGIGRKQAMFLAQ